MCVVSLIMAAKRDEWVLRYEPPDWQSMPDPVMPSQQEIDEFRRLLDRARRYDALHGEPDCELEAKRLALLKLAKELGCEDGVRKALEPAGAVWSG